MELMNKDLNLLFVFSAIWEERNLSKAADRLFLSQSAVSHALKRLRTDFGDPLFVRESKGVVPTDFAVALAPKVRQLLQEMEDVYHANRIFDPKEEKRSIVIAAGDYFSITMLVPFVERLTARAPHVRLITKPVANVFQPERFEKGDIHLAITAIEMEKREGFHLQEICREGISFCARKGHPQVENKISIEKYLKLKHINVSNFGSDWGVVDECLEAIDEKREVALVASSFFDAATLVRSTDLVLSAPHQICLGLAKEYDLAVYPFPLKHNMRSVSMVWHERTDKDPFHAWIRQMIFEIQKTII